MAQNEKPYLDSEQTASRKLEKLIKFIQSKKESVEKTYSRAVLESRYIMTTGKDVKSEEKAICSAIKKTYDEILGFISNG